MTRAIIFLVLSACLACFANAQSLVLYSGNGQIVYSASYQTTQPLVVEALDANGKPLPGVAISWTVTAGIPGAPPQFPSIPGNIPAPEPVTDSNGLASTNYTSATLNSEASFAFTTVTASSKYGSIDFTVITVAFLFGNPPPSINLVTPEPASTFTAAQGSTLPGAVQVKVQAGTGAQANAPIPNVSVFLVNGLDPTQTSGRALQRPERSCVHRRLHSYVCRQQMYGHRHLRCCGNQPGWPLFVARERRRHPEHHVV